MSKPLANLTGPLVALLGALLGASVISIPVKVWDYAEMSAMPASTDYMTVSPDSNVAAGFLVIGVALLAPLAAIVFLAWVHRATANLRANSQYPMSCTPGWAVGWYFVPFASLYMPYKGMADIWRASHHGRASMTPVAAWWALALSWVLAATIGIGAAPTGQTTHDYAVSLLYSLPADVILIPFLALTLWIVRKTGAAYARNVTEQPKGFTIAPPGWYADPAGQHELRYWDGATWTETVHSAPGAGTGAEAGASPASPAAVPPAV